MSDYTKKDLLNRAQSITQHWKDTWFFVATQDGFYFDSGRELIKNNGDMIPLDEKIITPEIQNKYLTVLKEFIRVKIKN